MHESTKTHGKLEYKTDLEEWSDFWHEYFALRPQYFGMVAFEDENSEKMKIYHTRIQDRLQKQRFNTRKIHQQHAQRYVPFLVQDGRPQSIKKRNKNTKQKGQSYEGFESKFAKYIPSSARLAAAVACPEFTPKETTLKLQAEIDALKRTLNELTLGAMPA